MVTPSASGQLVWLLFLKIFDDRELEWELMDDNYKSPIPESCRWRTWAADPEGITGDTLKDFIRQQPVPAAAEPARIQQHPLGLCGAQRI
jgi:HsdM N-terminal domain.